MGWVSRLQQQLCVLMRRFNLNHKSTRVKKVSDLEFERASAVEILRFSVDELKTELFARSIPFFSCAHKRELQLKLSEASAVVIDPTKLAVDAPAVSEIGEMSRSSISTRIEPLLLIRRPSATVRSDRLSAADPDGTSLCC